MFVNISAYTGDARIYLSIEEPGGHYPDSQLAPLVLWEIGVQYDTPIGIGIKILNIEQVPSGLYHITITANDYYYPDKKETCNCDLNIYDS